MSYVDSIQGRLLLHGRGLPLSEPETDTVPQAALVAALYSVPEPLRDKPRPVDRVNLEGFLERLPSGRTKATFWNAWKRCYFRAKDGFLYCYAVSVPATEPSRIVASRPERFTDSPEWD